MELRVLKYFLAVVEEENITRAAKKLHLTQPTLSRQMMQLEEELGIILFERGKNKIILTEDGMFLKKRAQEILHLTEKTKVELNKKEIFSGEISIGCGESTSMSILSKNIASFSQKYPLVQFHIFSATADEIKGKLEKGIIDIGLLMEPVEVKEYAFLRMKEKERWGILAPSSSELAQKDYITPEDLKGIPLIIAYRARVKDELVNWFGEEYGQVEVVATYNLIMNAANMVKNNVGIALCLDLDVTFEGLKFVPLKPKLETGSVIVWKKSVAITKTVKMFLEQLKESI